jgi:hypothetical protein
LRQLDGVEPTVPERLVGEGVLSHVDLAGVDPAKIAELAGIPIQQAEELVKQAKEKASGA